MSIVGRVAELTELTSAWQRAAGGSPELAVVWGRRRVGKTYLLTHFARNKRAVYFTATRQDADDRQLRRFAGALREQLGEEVADLAPETFPDWEAALRFVARLARTEPLLVVLDEAPRLTGGHADFADTVSAAWENHLRDQRLLLVLSGSAVAVMEQMLGPQGGLHRRAGVERRMDPFPLPDARAFLPDLPPEQFLEAYAACGGYPLHLRRWSAGRSTEENLDELAFTPGGLLLRDAPDILSEDLDWRGGYERVLTAMAGGARRRSRIAGRAQQRIDYTLDRLRRAGYVRAVRPIGSGGSADPMYEIADDYLAYWFAVLRDDADLIDGGQGPAVRRRTWGRWQTHLARVFEAAAREHAQRLVATGALPAETVVGRWWKDETAEIDVLGLVGDDPVLVGEARWQTRPLTLRDLADLRRRAGHLPPGAAGPTFGFWSRGGTDEALASHPEVRTFTPADMLAGTPGRRPRRRPG
ncbi:AAA family ATPase [Micromonospora sp. WMMD1102]|uniref:ATP-binding protein n=1 Tax=Micromonospora sp. WMMD1102 TaxID=3016105 RepID=UPI0024157185|nr:ATP-binding protein [Micromonospora sp. WMMD1102]MDG4790556.1 AAA family ATPase [Micromonospora sp. WMMD1102]